MRFLRITLLNSSLTSFFKLLFVSYAIIIAPISKKVNSKSKILLKNFSTSNKMHLGGGDMIGDKIKKLRQSNNLNQTQFGKKLFVTPGAVSQWEKGLTRPDTERLLQISKEFGVPLDYFNDGTEIIIDKNILPIRHNAVPIVGTIACGTPIMAEQNIDGYADLPDGVRADFALRCRGDSMTPTFNDGDIVLLRQQPDVENGQIAAVLIDGEATLKHVYHEQGGLLLVADNPAYAPMHVTQSDSEYSLIQGKAVGYTRMF
jgi:repressor LexA